MNAGETELLAAVARVVAAFEVLEIRGFDPGATALQVRLRSLFQ
jgi:hypothetical protein